ncbi:hypothetical protein A8C56_21810 [Niabella ginsenosidivorans]|uniref:Uncharacterized protein n=1 Tax=Niabella ginsenosidivorans TaxID=1176587 RepID=A0A1A9I9Q2_9BACT|nr:hypothetical protein [Niabella ginsenosidivorans]ANH83264.1 hypothetical protein A8C56_21810 [Niabella ginsenosidivorans]
MQLLNRPVLCFLLSVFSCCCLQLKAQRVSSVVYPSKKDSAHVFAPAKPTAAFYGVHPVNFPVLYYHRLGFMCRQEWKLEKATGTSFRVRLGTVENTDRMEGKIKPGELR